MMDSLEISSIIRSGFLFVAAYYYYIFFTSPTAQKPGDRVVPEKWLWIVMPLVYHEKVFTFLMAAIELYFTYLGITDPARFERSCPSITTSEFLSTSAATHLAFVSMQLGFMLRVKSYRELGQLYGFPLQIRQGHKLVTSGPYHWVRHPSYTAYFLYVWAMPLVFARSGGAIDCLGFIPESVKMVLRWLPVVNNAVALGLRIPAEERMLAKNFPDEWPEFARTRKRLIPWVY